MPTQISGNTGVSKVQPGVVDTSALAPGAVTPVKTQAGALPAMVRLHTSNGYGSTNTKIRRFTNTATNQGTDITYADSATLGASFTINTNGVYSVCYSDNLSTADGICVTLNDTNPAGAIPTLTAAEILSIGSVAVGGAAVNACWIGYVAAGSVIRARADGAATSYPALASFTITRVA